MGDGIKYVFEVDGQTPGVDELLEKLELAEKLLPKVTEHTKEAGKGHKKHGEEAKGLMGALQRLVHQGLEPFLERAKQVAEFEFIRKGVDALLEAPMELTEKVKELGEEIVLTAAKAERLDLSFKLTLGQEGAEEILGWIERISSKTEFTDDQLKGWASELLRAGVKMQDVDKFLAAGLDTAAKSTNKLEGMSNAIMALKNAQLTGRIETRQLRGLSLGIEELKTLPQFAGLSDKQLHKQMEEGKITKEDLLRLIAGKNGVLGDLGVAAGKTFEAQLKNVKEIPEQIYQGLYKTAGFEKLGAFLGSIYDSFGPETESGKHAAEALAGAMDYVATKLQSVDLGAIAEKVSIGLEALPIAIETTKNVFETVSQTVGVFGDVMDVVTKILHDFTPAGFVYDHFIKKTKAEENAEFEKGRDQAEVAYEAEQRRKHALARDAHDMGKAYIDPDAAFGPQEDPLMRRRKRIEQIRQELKNQGKNVADGLAVGMKAGGDKADKGGGDLADAAAGGLKKKAKIQSPSKVFAELGEQTAAGFVQGIKDSANMVDDIVAGAFAIPAPAGGRLASGAPIIVTVQEINVNAAPGSGIAEVAEALRPAVRSIFTEELERFRVENGG